MDLRNLCELTQAVGRAFRLRGAASFQGQRISLSPRSRASGAHARLPSLIFSRRSPLVFLLPRIPQQAAAAPTSAPAATAGAACRPSCCAAAAAAAGCIPAAAAAKQLLHLLQREPVCFWQAGVGPHKAGAGDGGIQVESARAAHSGGEGEEGLGHSSVAHPISSGGQAWKGGRALEDPKKVWLGKTSCFYCVSTSERREMDAGPTWVARKARKGGSRH